MSGKEDRTEAPTPKKLRESRRKGQIARSADLVMWAQLLAAGILLRRTVDIGSTRMRNLMGEVQRAFVDPEPRDAIQILGHGVRDAAVMLVPLMVGMVVVGLIGNLAQTRLAVSSHGLKPKWERVHPGKGFKRLLSPVSVWEAAKSVLKVAVLAAVAWPAVHSLATRLAGQRLAISGMLAIVGTSVLDLIRTTALAGLVLAAIDWAFQKRRIRKMLMMTKQEVKDEFRQSEGDPHTKSRIRQRQMEMSRNRMMSAVSGATVVVVNPTHIAVALVYEASKGAPRVVAKGRGLVAQRIREEAEKHKVPIVRDVPLARTLEKACKLGQEIPADMYEAVARVLAFVFSLHGRRAAS